jgi:hypothetical protein
MASDDGGSNERNQDGQPQPMSIGQYLLLAGRFVAGYILAVGVGTLVFAVTAQLVAAIPLLRDDRVDALAGIGSSVTVIFILGIVFAAPYTLVGSIIFWFATQRSPRLFLLIGTFCPAAAVLLFLSVLGSVGIAWPLVRFLLTTLPAGLAAAYIYGAIGFGHGFGRWRFA